MPQSKVGSRRRPFGCRLAIFEPGSNALQSISGGWPCVLADLKTLLETGEPEEVIG